MQMTIVDRRGDLTAELHELAERRLLFALSRFTPSVEQVTLVLADENGPRGGVDKSCNVTVKLRNSPDVHVASSHSSREGAIGRAANRVGRAVARVIDRNRRLGRERLGNTMVSAESPHASSGHATEAQRESPPSGATRHSPR